MGAYKQTNKHKREGDKLSSWPKKTASSSLTSHDTESFSVSGSELFTSGQVVASCTLFPRSTPHEATTNGQLTTRAAQTEYDTHITEGLTEIDLVQFGRIFR